MKKYIQISKNNSNFSSKGKNFSNCYFFKISEIFFFFLNFNNFFVTCIWNNIFLQTYWSLLASFLRFQFLKLPNRAFCSKISFFIFISIEKLLDFSIKDFKESSIWKVFLYVVDQHWDFLIQSILEGKLLASFRSIENLISLCGTYLSEIF